MPSTQVLVPIDGSEFSLLILNYIKRLLAPASNQLILLRVVAEPLLPTTEGTTLDDMESYQQRVRAQRVAELSAELLPHRQELEAAGFAVTTAVLFGDPLVVLQQFIESVNIELVAMTTHGHSGLRALLLGSVAQHLLRHAGVPLLLYRPVGYD